MGGESVAPDPRTPQTLTSRRACIPTARRHPALLGFRAKHSISFYVPFSMGGNEDGPRRGRAAGHRSQRHQHALLRLAAGWDCGAAMTRPRPGRKSPAFRSAAGETAAGRQRWRVVGLSLVVFDPPRGAREPSKKYLRRRRPSRRYTLYRKHRFRQHLGARPRPAQGTSADPRRAGFRWNALSRLRKRRRTQ